MDCPELAPSPVPEPVSAHAFGASDRAAVYRAILTRRDVRSQFLPDPVPDAVLSRLLVAAHHAPSVGFMQPWTFIVIRAREVRARIHDLFVEANAAAATRFEGERQALYRSLKLQGILDAPVNLCITCDPDRAGPVVLGRTHDLSVDRYSTVCAVQNLWLAARAEGLGLGWVSILDPAALKQVLGIPERIVPIAYLCLGWVSEYLPTPELAQKGWRQRLGAEEVLRLDGWSGDPESSPLLDRFRADIAAVAEGTFPDPAAA